MPLVNLPRNKGIARFPDNMPLEDIERAIKKDMLLDDLEALDEPNYQGVYLDELGNQLAGNFEQTGVGITQGMSQLAAGVNKLGELMMGSGIGGAFLLPESFRTTLEEQFAGASEISHQASSELEQLGEETPGSALPRRISAGVVSSAPSLVAAPAGLLAAASTAAVQQFGNSLVDYQAHYRSQGMDNDQSLARAFSPALASGIITGLVTAGYGKTGIEAIKVAGPRAFGSMTRAILREAGYEAAEETTDEIWQTVLEEVTIDPTKSPSEVLSRAFTALSAGLVAGGAVQAAVQAGGLNPEEARQLAERDLPPVAVRELPAPTEEEPQLELDLNEEQIQTEIRQAVEEPKPIPFPEFPESPKESASEQLQLGIVPPITAEAQEGLEMLKGLFGDKPPEGPNFTVSGDNFDDQIEKRGHARDYHIWNRVNTGLWTFGFGKLGPNAQKAWETMALGEFEMTESISRDVKFTVNDLVGRLPRDIRKNGSKAFFEVLDGKTIEEIEAEWTGKRQGKDVIDAARQVKDRLEEIRVTIRDTKRTSLQSYLLGQDRNSLVKSYLANVNPDADPDLLAGLTKADMAGEISFETFPDTWGISDGTYIPHLFMGGWAARVAPTVDEQGKETKGKFILRGETAEEAKLRLKDLLAANPDMAGTKFVIEPDFAIPADIVRLGDRQFFTLIGEMKKNLEISGSEVKDATLGIIGRKASKQKWFGSLLARLGAKNYETDFQKVMTAYLFGFHRWRVLSRVNKETSPLIEQVEKEGRSRAANELNTILKFMWGTPTDLTLDFDRFLHRIPFIKDRVRPLALDRWTRMIRSVGATAFLLTLRFRTLQFLQPLQGLYPVLGERTFVRAKILQHTQEGRKILDRYGVTFDVGAYGEPTTIKSKAQKLREKITGERANQEIAFLGMYLHGLDTGLTPQEAASFAKIRGQLMTQFTPLVSTTPPLLRGPLNATIFQFSRFPIGQLELIARMLKERRIGGLTRLLGVYALFGGLSFLLRSAFRDEDESLHLKRQLNEQIGEDKADWVFYGIPGLAGVDMSGSLLLVDEPFGDNFYEKLGRRLTGPVASTIYTLATQIATEPREPISPVEKALNILRRIPTFRPFIELAQLEDRQVDVKTPDGEVSFRRTLNDIIVSLGAFRGANESNVRLAVDGMIELKTQQREIKNRLFVNLLANQSIDPILEEIEQFNRRWPEIAFTPDEVFNYIETRLRGLSKTDIERMAGRKYLPLLPESQLERTQE